MFCIVLALVVSAMSISVLAAGQPTTTGGVAGYSTSGSSSCSSTGGRSTTRISGTGADQLNVNCTFYYGIGNLVYSTTSRSNAISGTSTYSIGASPTGVTYYTAVRAEGYHRVVKSGATWTDTTIAYY